MTLDERRKLVDYATKEFSLSSRKACQELSISRSSYYYKSIFNEDEVVESALLELAIKYKKYGCRKLYQKLRQRGFIVNHKKIRRLYKKHKLNLRIKPRKRLKVERKPLPVPTSPMQVWALDLALI